MSVAAVSTTVQQQQQQLAAPSTGAQPGSRAGTIIKSAAIGGVVGAAALAGLSFTALPFIGALSAPIAAAIGGVAGLAIGGIVGWLRSRSGGDDANGYLYVSTDQPWPFDPLAEGRFPDSWVTDGEVVDRLRRHQPRIVRVGLDGTETPDGLRVAYVPSPFRFCLRCKVSYEQARGSDFAKLATLDAEGRSSAVSVISASIVRSLKQLPLDELPGTTSCPWLSPGKP